MKYEVINTFLDKEHDSTIYLVGELYPKEGYKATKKRVAFLRSNKNKYNKPFLGKEVNEVVDTND